MRLSFVTRPLTIATTILLVACTTSTPLPRPMPTLAYQKYPPMRLNVAQIQVVDNYTAQNQPPFIEGQMASPLPQVVHNWASNRFQARGQDGVLTITIEKASVTTDSLKRTTGMRGMLTIDQAQKLAGQIDVKFTVANVSFGSSGSANVGVKGMRTVTEDASLQQQDIVLADLTDGLMLELDAGTQRVFADKLPSLMQQGGMNGGNQPANTMPKSNF